MRIQCVRLFSVGLLLVLLAGCNSTNMVNLPHVFPPTGVRLEPGARIQVIGFDRSPASTNQLGLVREILNDIQGIQVVESNPDYWLVTGWISGYGQSDATAARFSAKTTRGVSEEHYGGHENTVIQPQTTTSCALVATFSLVRAADLTPVRIFHVGMYDSDFSAGNARGRGMYVSSFRQGLTSRLREVFIPGNRSIEHMTVIPDNAPADLVSRLGSPDFRVSLPPFEQFCQDMRTGRFPGNTEEMLSGYFLAFLNEEFRCAEADSLMRLHRGYLQLAELTGNSSLVDAASRGMARIEEKLRILGHKLSL